MPSIVLEVFCFFYLATSAEFVTSGVSLFALHDIFASKLLASVQNYKQIKKTDAALFVLVSVDNAMFVYKIYVSIGSRSTCL
jgi:hypothetical protein